MQTKISSAVVVPTNTKNRSSFTIVPGIQRNYIQIQHNQHFFQGNFDGVFMDDQVYQFLQSFLIFPHQGENLCIFLYGEGGAQKTKFIKQEFLRTLLTNSLEKSQESKLSINLCSLIVSNKGIFDCLHNETRRQHPFNPRKGMSFSSINRVLIDSQERINQFCYLIQAPIKQRASLDIVEDSFVIQISLQRGEQPFSKLFLVDLPSLSLTTNRRINITLHVLFSIILKSEKNIKLKDSKLTQLLNTDLQNSHILFIGFINPLKVDSSIRILESLQNLQQCYTEIHPYINKNPTPSENLQKPSDLSLPPIKATLFRQQIQYQAEINLDIESLLQKRGTQLQQAIENIKTGQHKNEIYRFKKELKTTGRCPICTLRPPCIHSSSTRQPNLQKPEITPQKYTPIINISSNSHSFISKNFSTPRATRFKVRIKGPSNIHSFSTINSRKPRSRSTEFRRLKILHKIEKYHQDKLIKAINQIEAIRKENQSKREEQARKEVKLKLTQEKNKALILNYHKELEKRRQQHQKRVQQLQKIQVEKERRRQVYFARQKKSIADFHKSHSAHHKGRKVQQSKQFLTSYL